MKSFGRSVLLQKGVILLQNFLNVRISNVTKHLWKLRSYIHFKMSFSTEDKVIIKHYCLDKHYGVKNLLKEFPNKDWRKGGLRHLLRKIDKIGILAQIPGSGRTPTALTNENV